jgi:acetolactate synthase I/II/III large subunit
MMVRADRRLLISGIGDGATGAGLLIWDGRRVERLDNLPTAGLAVGGGRLWRLIRSGPATAGLAQLRAYGPAGESTVVPLPGLPDPHDVSWHDGALVLVSTHDNSIIWLRSDGHPLGRWRAPGHGDAWHLNCLAWANGRLHVSAFGRFDAHRGWAEPGYDLAGFVLDLQSGREVVREVGHPHSPRYFDGRWLVCESYDGRVIQVDPGSQEITRELTVNGYPRGVAVTSDRVYVGVSALRPTLDDFRPGHLAVLCRDSWAVLDRIELPTVEVYDVLEVTAALAEGVRRAIYGEVAHAATV